MRVLTVLIFATALTACAIARTVQPSDPHGRVVTQIYHAPNDTHPVVVVAINDVNLRAQWQEWRASDTTDPPRQVFLLAPGRHTIALAADLSESRQPFARHQRNRLPHGKAIEFEVEVDKEYTLAARVTGPSLADWEPVIVSVRDLK